MTARKTGTRKPRKSTPRNIDLLKRRRQALELRYQRYTFDQIADILDYSDGGNVWHDVQSAMDELIKEPAEMVRAQEIELLDKMARGLRVRASKGDDKAIQSMLRIQERRARLLGLDAPVQTHMTGAPFNIVVNPDLLPEGANLGAVNDDNGD